MSRYLERAEDVARIIAVNYQATLDAPAASRTLAWEPVIAISGSHVSARLAAGASSEA
jgi:uncharacterized alpha-E superfamily protein